MRFQAAFGCETRGQRVPTLLCQRCFAKNMEAVAVELYCRRHVGTDTRNAGCVGWALVAHAVVLWGGCMPVRFQAAFRCGARGQRVPALLCQRCSTRISGCLCQYLPRCLHAPVGGFFKHGIAAQIAVREHDARTVGAQGGKQGRI